MGTNAKKRWFLARISGRGERWDNGERNVIERLADYDLKDVFRYLYSYDKEEFSIVLKNRGRVFPRRFDHCFASESLKPVSMLYIHSLREKKLSDHSPIVVVFEPQAYRV